MTCQEENLNRFSFSDLEFPRYFNSFKERVTGFFRGNNNESGNIESQWYNELCGTNHEWHPCHWWIWLILAFILGILLCCIFHTAAVFILGFIIGFLVGVHL